MIVHPFRAQCRHAASFQQGADVGEPQFAFYIFWVCHCVLSFVLAANLRKIVQFHLPFRAKSATFSSERKQFATGPFLVQGYPLAPGFAATPCICHKKAVFSSCLTVVACLHFNVSFHLLSRACRTYPATYAPKTLWNTVPKRR